MAAVENFKLVTDIVGCAVAEDANKNLQQILKQNMIAPNFTILRQAMDASIVLAVEKQENKYFEFAESLALWLSVIPLLKTDQRELIWTEILNGDKTPALIEEEKERWSWEKFFDWELKHSLNAKQCYEPMKALYNAKRLSIFRAKHYSKVLFTLLRLGADPFEKKLAKNNTYSKTLTYAILTSKKLKKQKRLELLRQLSQRNLLRADPSGPDNISPIQICLTDDRKRYALKFMLKAGAIDKLQFQGDNILQDCRKSRQYENILSYLTVEQIKSLLRQPSNSFLALYSMETPKKCVNFENFFTAIKELLQEHPTISVERLLHLMPAEFFVQYSNQECSKLADGATKYWRNAQLSFKPTANLKFNGNTEFPFEHLPVEISEMICTYLPAIDRFQLLSVNKYMHRLKDSFGEYFWKTTLRTAFPVVYSHLQNGTSDKTWHERTLSAIRSAENLKHGRFVRKTLTFKKFVSSVTAQNFDEYWLCAGTGSNLMFWNCNDGGLEFDHCHQLPFSPYSVKYLNSTPFEVPSIVCYDRDKIYYHINNASKCFNIADLNLKRTFGMSPFATPLSPRKFIFGHSIFDIELEKVVANFPKDDVHSAKKQLFSDNIVGVTQTDVVIYDKDLREVAKYHFPRSENHHFTRSLTILDDNLVYLNNDNSVIDIRTMRPLHTNMKVWLGNTNGAYRSLLVEKGVCTVWNLKTNTWETNFALPNEANLYNHISNSRYAVFPLHAEPRYSKMIVLDFDSILN